MAHIVQMYIIHYAFLFVSLRFLFDERIRVAWRRNEVGAPDHETFVFNLPIFVLIP
jgi:hypothetical protein